MSASRVPETPVEVFVSYSHRDEPLQQELVKHLSILRQQNVLDTWHDREITAGSDWEGAIDAHLNSADVILLLISADFLASQYCYGIELKRALERHRNQEARVIPVILRPVDWGGAPFAKLQALPKNAKPVTSWTNQDEALMDVAIGIRRAIAELRQRQQNCMVSNPLSSRSHPQIPTGHTVRPPKTVPIDSQSASNPAFSSLPAQWQSQSRSNTQTRSFTALTWIAIALIPTLWIGVGAFAVQDAFDSTQDLIAKFIKGLIGGLLTGGLGAFAWHTIKPAVPLETLLIYILICSGMGGLAWGIVGGNWAMGLVVGAIAAFATYGRLNRVCTDP